MGESSPSCMHFTVWNAFLSFNWGKILTLKSAAYLSPFTETVYSLPLEISSNKKRPMMNKVVKPTTLSVIDQEGIFLPMHEGFLFPYVTILCVHATTYRKVRHIYPQNIWKAVISIIFHFRETTVRKIHKFHVSLSAVDVNWVTAPTSTLFTAAMDVWDFPLFLTILLHSYIYHS